MSESVYKVIELVGTSTESWEKAAAEVGDLDMLLSEEGVVRYRPKVKISFKYQG